MGIITDSIYQSGVKRVSNYVSGYLLKILFLAHSMIMKSLLPNMSSNPPCMTVYLPCRMALNSLNYF